MFTHEFKRRIRYGETDPMGYFYYGNYCLLYEIGRAEAIRSLGLSYHDMEKVHRIMMPVLHVESRFLKPARYDELITIKTIVRELPTKLSVFHHELVNENGELIHKGIVKLFYVDMDSQKRISCPPIVSDRLLPYFE